MAKIKNTFCITKESRKLLGSNKVQSIGDEYGKNLIIFQNYFYFNYSKRVNYQKDLNKNILKKLSELNNKKNGAREKQKNF